jgi:diguanylate cyclase
VEKSARIIVHDADSVGVLAIAERVRMTIATATVLGHADVDRVTASIGVAVLRDADTDRMLREADLALYAAKGNGRNRVEVAPDPAVVKAGSSGAHL